MKKGENLKEKVYTLLKNRIIHFELKPGERVQERKLSMEFGASRTPLREALNKLEKEGFIKTLPHKGYFVSEITQGEVVELYKVREALEALAIKEAILKGTQEDWTRLKQILLTEEQDKNSRLNKDWRFDVGRTFHDEIIHLSKNLTLQQVLKNIYEKIDRIRWVDIFFIDRAEQSLKEHLEILNSLRDGNTEEAIRANQSHIQHSTENLLHLLEKKMSLFYIA